MSTVLDNFTDIVGTLLEAHTSGGMTWAKASSSTESMVIRAAGGMRQLTGSATFSGYGVTSPSTASADYAVSASLLPQTGFANNIGIGARVQSDGVSGYFAIYQAGSSPAGISLFKISAGTYTQLGSVYGFAPTIGTSFLLTITVSGSTISVAVNGTTQITATDTTFSAGTPGINVYGSGSSSDTAGWAFLNFSFTNAGSSGGSLPTITVPASDSTLVYSPYNWAKGTYANGTYNGYSYAAAVNPGAYIRHLHTLATSCVLYFDVSNLGAFVAGDLPHIAVRVDNGAWVRYAAATSINVSSQLNANSSTGQQHLLEIVFSCVGTSGGQERFNVGGGTGIVAPVASLIFLGISYNSGATWLAPPRRKFNLLLMGDSITEGVDALGPGNGATGSGIYNCAELGWAFMMAQACDAEVGCVGFSGQAVGNTIYYAHNALTTYANIFQGVARNFASPAPDVVMLDWGTNDGASTESVYVAGIQTIHAAIVAAAPSTKFGMWEDYRAQQTAGEIAAMAAIGGTLVTGLLDGAFMTNGIVDSYDSNHPTATTHATKMLPVISSGVLKLLLGRSATYF